MDGVLRTDPMTDERKRELKVALEKMQAVSDRFYNGAIHTGCHPFIEFCGLINEYINVCRRSLEAGIDFADANTHVGLLKKGYTAFAMLASGKRGHKITDFDPALQEILFSNREVLLVPPTIPG